MGGYLVWSATLRRPDERARAEISSKGTMYASPETRCQHFAYRQTVSSSTNVYYYAAVIYILKMDAP